jgi:hypothetical protein
MGANAHGRGEKIKRGGLEIGGPRGGKGSEGRSRSRLRFFEGGGWRVQTPLRGMRGKDGDFVFSFLPGMRSRENAWIK